MNRVSSEECEAGDELSKNTAKRRVLIVEDDADNRTICRLILQHGGFEVNEAQNGLEGLHRARTERPDLILMDLSIPLMDGWEVMEILRGEEATRTIPILVLSAHAFREDQKRAKALGCAGFLVKPIAPSLILEAVSLHVGGSGGDQPSASQPRPTA